LRRLSRFIVSGGKWLVIAAASVEVLSFLIITASNFMIYGHAREGSRARYDPYTLFLMAEGIRPTAHNPPAPDPKHNRRIWLFGGSTIRGATDSDERTIPSFVSLFMNEGALPPRSYTVTNLGVNSFNSLLETKYLQKMLIESPSPPHVVVFYDGANDAKYFAEHRTPYGHHAYRRVESLIESYRRSWFGLLKPLNAALYASFTRELYDKIHQGVVPLDADSPLLGEMVDLTEKRYDHVDRISRAYGAKFLLVWQPVRWVETCQVRDAVLEQEGSIPLSEATLAAVRENFAVPYHALARRLETKPYFVSLQHVLCERHAPSYQRDGVHLTDSGREIVARRMVVLLREMELDR
jgi:lysophospholipase L1-like esterase